jgi:glutamate dehydrogenase
LRIEKRRNDADPTLAAKPAEDTPLRVRKSQEHSRIHRAGRLDHILVRWFDEGGDPAGVVVLEGLFTYRALARPAAEIPMLAPKLQRLLEDAGLPPDSYRARSLRYVFSSLPVGFLFMAPYEDVSVVVDRILTAAESRTPEVTYSIDVPQQIAYAFVAIPKAEYDDELRSAAQELLGQHFGAPVVDHGVSIGALETAVIHFFISGSGLRAPSLETLREALMQVVAPWRERLKAALRRHIDESATERLLARYAEAFPEEYRQATSPARIVADIEHLESLGAAYRDHGVDAAIYAVALGEWLAIRHAHDEA